MKSPLRLLLLPLRRLRRRREDGGPMLSSSSALAPDLSAAHVFAPSSTVNFRLYPGGVHHPAYSSVYPPAIQHPTLLRLRRPNPISGKPQTRGYATQTPSPLTLQVFNAATKHQQRERAASDAETSRRVDYLRDEVAGRLCERLLDIKRHFPHILDLGANACNVARAMTESPELLERLSSLTSADSSQEMLHRDAELSFNKLIPAHTRTVLPLPDTAPLMFPPRSFSAVVSSLSLHWINDLPSLLAQTAQVLQSDSPFLAAMLGGDSLFELRSSLQLADLDRRGGVSTHMSPLANVRDMGGLLTKAGFKMLTVDVDDIVVEYPDTFALMQDLQAMGESNAVLRREMGGLHKDVLLANEAIYREMYGNADGSLPATFRIIFMIGWTEGEDQPQPLKRGSGQVSIKDILEGGG